MSSSPSLPVVPLNKKVLLPSVVIKLIMSGSAATELVRNYFKSRDSLTAQQSSFLIACVPLHRVPDTRRPLSDAGTLVADEMVPFLSRYGCSGRILRVQRLANEMYGIYVEGVSRFRIDLSDEGHAATSTTVRVDYYDNDTPPAQAEDNDFGQLVRGFVKKLEELQISTDLITQMQRWIATKPMLVLADLLVCLIDTSFEEKLQMLETTTAAARMELAKTWMRRQLHLLQIQEQVNSHVEARMSRQQREFYLRQQLEAIQHSANTQKDHDDPDLDEASDLRDLKRRLVAAKLPSEALAVAQRELVRLQRLDPSSLDWGVGRRYLELLADLPWENKSSELLDVARARKQLDCDHYGVSQVKKRIIECLSVAKVTGDLRPPILCLVGPPGVGKTSLGKSIAAALSRKFYRVSLGGVRDEADMRGHRRTYAGAMPGLIIQGIRRSGVSNPVLLLDELDKLGCSRSHGNPAAAALLEVLDPEQNHSFHDHYLNIPFDLSSVVFIATANSVDTILPPLLDRMEVIHLGGYTAEEKLNIAKTHLLPRQLQRHGLASDQLKIADEVLAWIMKRYTQESGVRGLERALASVVRAKCVELAESRAKKAYDPHVTRPDLYDILGLPLYDALPLPDRSPGVINSLTEERGGVLVVEAMKTPGGHGKLVLTGSLGAVLREAAQLALAWVRASSVSVLGDAPSLRDAMATHDIHIHVPAGSAPKDGPSAGLAVVLALVTVLRNQPLANQETTAVAGEMTLRGRILPVKQIKNKVVSAYLAGIRTLVLPEQNRADVEAHVPETVRRQIHFVYVATVQHALDFLIPAAAAAAAASPSAVSVTKPQQQSMDPRRAVESRL
ncbi:P-loop containing nucleoside triphosphate hydrolase protein [Dichotomocladium elegans]|nr:P-loop containing nucleoside triphosphate hydrolase protein [Dichotomocladium elegans]